MRWSIGRSALAPLRSLACVSTSAGPPGIKRSRASGSLEMLAATSRVAAPQSTGPRRARFRIASLVTGCGPASVKLGAALNVRGATRLGSPRAAFRVVHLVRTQARTHAFS
jgi:hypothetical protein